MSSHNPDRLYQLLPAIHRIRDAENGYPLQALLRLIEREADIVDDDLWQLYADWFIETGADWTVPYIGELVGFRPAPQAGDPTNLDVSDPLGRARALTPRRDVANTVHDRRRKGTASLLEEIARDAAGWPARVAEFYRWLTWAQNINHQRPGRGGTISLRSGRALARLRGPYAPFDETAHTPDIRQPGWTDPIGRGSLPGVGVFVWRLRSYSVTRCRAENIEEVGPHIFTFSVLGNNTPLFNRPQPEADPYHVAGPLNLPVPITRREFEERLPRDPAHPHAIRSIASGDYYGMEKSLAVWAVDWPSKGAPQPVPRQSIVPADLSSWTLATPRDHIAIDPELGRMAFPTGQLPRGGVYVSYQYGFAAAIGGGEYDRPLLESAPGGHGEVTYRVGHDRPETDDTLGAALARWRALNPRPPSAIIEIVDSGVYTEPLNVELDAGESLQVRAANRARPVIRLLDYMVDRPDPFQVRGAAGSRFTLDGLLVTGRGLAIYGPDAPAEGQPATGDLCAVTIRHCTLVPGWGLANNCDPLRPAEASLELHDTSAHVRIQHSILGAIRVYADRASRDPLRLDLSDSIVDSTGGHDCDRPECQAIGAPDSLAAHVVLEVRRCTIFGRVFAHAVTLGENSLCMGLVRVARRQVGCLRFCYVPPGSRTPPRYECQPDRAIKQLGLTVANPDRARLEALEAQRVRPQFMSTRYGTPDYARLAESCADEIRMGADDGSEMGVYHDLYEPQRAALLRLRLDEFTPAGMDAGLIFAS